MKTCRLVGVTYGEFQAWYFYGETQLLRDRFVDILSKEGTDEPDAECPRVETLLQRLPPLSLDDEEGVLIVQMTPKNRDAWRNSDDRQMVIASIKAVKRVIPLTERARRILEPRMDSFGVHLAEPYFCSRVREAWYQADVDTAQRGGDALLDMLIEGDSQLIDDNLRKAMAPATRALKDEAAGSSASKEYNTWVDAAFRWARRKPYDFGNFNSPIDAFKLLQEWDDDSWLKHYGAAVSSLKKELGTAEPLENILSRPEFKTAADELKLLNTHAFPASLSSLVLFLHWKEQFHQRKECIDVMDLAKEVKRFIPAVGIEETAAAVWLIGRFAGHERIAAAVYAADADSYEWFAGNRLEIEKAGPPASDPVKAKEAELHASTADAALSECKSALEAEASENLKGNSSDGATAVTCEEPDSHGAEVNPQVPTAGEILAEQAQGSVSSADKYQGQMSFLEESKNSLEGSEDSIDSPGEGRQRDKVSSGRESKRTKEEKRRPKRPVADDAQRQESPSPDKDKARSAED